MAGMAMRGVECHVFQDAAYASGPASDLAFHGSTVHPFEDPVAGIAEVATVLDRPGPLFAFIYLDTIDSIGHLLDRGAGVRRSCDRIAGRILEGLCRQSSMPA